MPSEPGASAPAGDPQRDGSAARGPLAGVRVLDFSTRLPGPLASLILADAGADVIKIERPDGGDEARAQEPRFGGDGAVFALLNRGKRSVAIDLKAPGALRRLVPLIASADVLIEQFRPGVMDRLGLGYESVRELNPGLIYCAISSYGSVGPLSDAPGHDLNYLAESGLLALTAGAGGAPVIPPGLAADVAGGSYPAVMNIVLALRLRDRSGAGCKLDVAMCDNLFALMPWALAQGWATGQWPRPGDERLTGGSPRYQVYRASDDRFIACSPLEDRFWTEFCDAIGLSGEYRDGRKDRDDTRREIARIIAGQPAEHWMSLFSSLQLPCSIVRTLQEATDSPHFRSRGVFDARVERDGAGMCALPLPLGDPVRATRGTATWPRLGEHNALLSESEAVPGS